MPYKFRTLVAFLLIGSFTTWFFTTKLFSARKPNKVHGFPSEINARAQKARTQIKATFTVANDTEILVNILDVATSCGCSVASISTRSLPPGSIATIDVVGTPPSAGLKPVSINLSTDSSITPSLQFKLVMEGAAPPPFVHYSNTPVNLGVISSLQTKTEVIIDTREFAGTNHWITSWKSDIESLKVTGGFNSERPYTPGIVSRKYRFDVIVDSNASVDGPYNHLIQFFDSSGSSVLSSDVRGTIEPPYSISPSRLTASFDALNASRSVKFLVRSKDRSQKLNPRIASRTNLNISQLTSDSPHCVYLVTPDFSGSDFLEGDIEVSIDGSPETKLKLPFSFKLHR